MILNNELAMALTRFSNEERKHLSQLHAAWEANGKQIPF